MIDFTDAPKLKKGYGGANGNKISILLNGSRWMLKFPSIFRKPFYEILEIAKRVIALNCKTGPAAFRLKDFCCLVHLPDSRGEHSQRDNAFQVPR